MSSPEVKIRLSLDGAQQVQAGTQAAAAGMDRLERSTATVGRAAQLSGYQMAQVSAQLQDLFVQIQGGQAPLTALAQQGSQLSAVFGGMGNAVRAVASLITPTVAALGGAALAVGGLAAAYAQGSQEADAFRRAVVLSGNAAGVTVGQLQDMARAQAALVGTQGRAAEVFAALAASGNVARAQMSAAADAALRLERVGGPAAEETAKKFAKLGEDPVKALVELNKAENFLTEGVYRQVKALQDQGRTAEAAALAQSTYAATVAQRADQLSANLGTLERAWNAIKDKAKAAWDAMLNIGRQDTPKQRLDEVSASLAAARERLSKAQSGEGVLPGVDTSRVVAAREREVRQLEARVLALQQGIRWNAQYAASEREAAEAVKATIAAEEDAARKAKEAAAAKERENAEIEKAIGLTGSYMQDLQRLQALRTKGKITEEQYIAAVRKVAAEQPVLIEAHKKEKEALDALNRSIEAGAKAYDKHLEELRKSADGIEEQVRKLQDEEAALLLSASANITLAQAVQKVAIARLQEKQAKSQDLGEVDALQREIEARQKLAGLIDSKDAREASKKAADDAAKEWQRASESIERSLTDALLRGFESGKDFGKNLADTLKNLFGTLVLRPIIQPVAGAMAAFFGGPAAASTGVGAGGFNMTSLLGNGLDFLKGNYLTNAATFGAEALGQWLVKNSSGGLNALGGSILQNTGMLGTGLGMLGNAFAGYGLSRGLSGGYSAGGWVDPLAGIASAIPGVGPIAGLVGAAINRAFGSRPKEVTDSGISGSIGGGDFTGQTFADWQKKGGWFRSTKRGTDFGAVDQQLADALDLGASAILANAKGWASALQLPADQLASITTSFRVSLTNDQAKNQELIAKLLSDYSAALVAGFAGDLGPFQRAGETASQTLERLAGSLTGVNDVLTTLGQTALLASAAGGDAASQLLDLLGGIGNFTQLSGQYLADYYTEAEKSALVTQQLSATLGQFGIALPASRDAYRQLIEAQDLNTESGRKAYAALLQLAPTFAQLVPALQDTGAAAAEAARLAEEAAQRQIEAGQRALASLASESGRLQVELLRAQGKVAEAAALERQQALAQITAGLSAADAAAAASAYDLNAALQAQIDATLGAAAAARDAAQQQAQAEAARVAQQQAVAAQRENLEREILRLTGDSAELRRRELEALDPSNRALQERIYSLTDQQALDAANAREAEQRAAEQARLSQEAERAAEQQLRAAEQLRDAWLRIGDSLLEEVARIRGLGAGGAAGSLTQARTAFAIATGQARAGDQSAAQSLPQLSRTLLDLVGATATSSAMLERERAQIAASLEGTAGVLGGRFGFPVARQSGGDAPLSVPDIVRQVAATAPLAAPPATPPAADPELLAEVRSLRAQVAALAEQVQRVTRATETSADTLVRVTEGGRAMQTEVAS